MAKTKKGKRATKPKAKAKKELQIVPRLRLEPRLTPKPSKKALDKPVTEDNPGLLKTHEQHETSPLAASLSCDPSKEIRNCFEQVHETSNLLNTVYAAAASSSSSSDPFNEIKNYEQVHEASNLLNTVYASSSSSSSPSDLFNEIKDYEQEHEASTVDTQVSVGSTVQEEKEEHVAERKPFLRKSYDWDDRERLDLAVGLQNEGTSDLKKLAAYVKTKNENDISVYLKKRSLDARKSENPFGRLNGWSSVSPENLAKWPNVRKWRKLAYEQMLSHIRSKDYSKPVILALCKKFFEEEMEPADPQVINVKMIYKYMMDCMSGEIPAQLPPKESALVLDLLREVRLMPLAYDFEEELKFLKGFKEATKFRPFEVKDEFKKRFKKSHNDELLGPNTVSVPEEVFMDLSRHKKLIQSFNPLVSPVWMLQKEQEVFEKHEESAVYVD